MVFIILCLSCILPLVIVLSSSVSNEVSLIKSGYSLIPRDLSLKAYQYIFNDPRTVLNAYVATIISALGGTLLGILFTTLTAYTLTRPEFKYRGVIGFMVYFTLLFNGGIVPSYILITRYLHMGDTLWVLFVPSLIVPYYIFIMRRFLSDIPVSIIESVKIDGGSEYTIFFRIVVPMAKSGIAAITLLLLLGYWNSWWPSLMYIDKPDLVTLQYLLYKILANVQALTDPGKSQITLMQEIPSVTLRMALCIVSIGPMIIFFPFFQKYMVKGITAGAVKG